MNADLTHMFDAEALRDLRRSALLSARRYRDQYRREGFGFERRMMHAMLEQAREYRAAEHQSQQHQQRAA